MAVRDIVLKSLQAIGAPKEAQFYTKIFQHQDPEKFALIVIDPRCLKNPLFEVLISDLKILSDLELTPVLLVGALDADSTSVRFQSQRLCNALDKAGIVNAKLNCASYEFMPSVCNITRSGKFAVLELTDTAGTGTESKVDLQSLIIALQPLKVIFLQPSGGFRVGGKRLPVVNIDRVKNDLDVDLLSKGQMQFLNLVDVLATDVQHHLTFVIASPLNLLTELFTVKGGGTLLRRGVNIKTATEYAGFDREKIRISMEGAFERRIVSDYFVRPVTWVGIEKNYRGGAIVMDMSGLAYLSKFWVTREAQGEGIALDIWHALENAAPRFFWRCKKDNTFNHWYIKICDGMQVSGEWRVFWKGLDLSEVAHAIHTATIFPNDFEV